MAMAMALSRLDLAGSRGAQEGCTRKKEGIERGQEVRNSLQHLQETDRRACKDGDESSDSGRASTRAPTAAVIDLRKCHKKRRQQ